MAISDNVSLIFRLKSDNNDAIKGLKQVETGIGNLSGVAKSAASGDIAGLTASLGKMASGLGGVSMATIGAVAGITALVGAAVGVIKVLFDMTKQAAEFGSKIYDASQKTGASAETLTALKYAADTSGSSLEGVVGGLTKFAKAIGLAQADNKKLAKTFLDMGLDVKSFQGSTDDALRTVLPRFNQVQSQFEKTRIATELFGKSGADLIPTIQSFNGNLDQLVQTASDLNQTIDDSQAAMADRFGDTLDNIQKQLEGVARTVGFELMPVFQETLDQISVYLMTNKGAVQDWARATKDGVTSVLSALGELVRFYRDNEEILNIAGIAAIGGRVGGVKGAIAGGVAAGVFELIQWANPEEITKGLPQLSPDEAAALKKILEERQKAAIDNWLKATREAAEQAAKEKEDEDEKANKDSISRAQKKIQQLREEMNLVIRSIVETAGGKANLTQFFTQEINEAFAKYKELILGYLKEIEQLKNESDALGVEGTRERLIEEGKLNNEFADLQKETLKKNSEEIAKIKKEAFDKEEAKIRDQMEVLERNANKRIAEEATRLAGSKNASELLAAFEYEITQKRLKDQLNALGILGKNQYINAEDRKRLLNEIDQLTEKIFINEQNRQRAVAEYLNAAYEKRKRNEIEIANIIFKIGQNQIQKEIEGIERVARKRRLSDDERKRLIELKTQLIENALEQELRELKRQEDEELSLLDEKLLGYEEFEKQKTAITRKYALLRQQAEGEAAGQKAGVPSTVEKGQESALERLKRLWQEYFNTIKDGTKDMNATLGTMGGMALDMLQNIEGALKSSISNWILYGESVGKALKKALAAQLASVAAEAAVWALKAAALGFYLLAIKDYSGAASAFKSAAVWGAVAVLAGVTARAIAKGSFENEASRATSGGGRSDRNTAGQGQAFSSQGNQTINASQSGVSLMPTAEIVIKDASGMFSQLFEAEIRNNSRVRRLIIDTANS